MTAENSGLPHMPKNSGSERRENSYKEPLPSAPDIQWPGEAGDVGNGPATGHTKPPVPEAPSQSKKKKSVESAAGSPSRPNVSEDTAPDEGAEPGNLYSGT
jgi:hypothetical protein